MAKAMPVHGVRVCLRFEPRRWQATASDPASLGRATAALLAELVIYGAGKVTVRMSGLSVRLDCVPEDWTLGQLEQLRQRIADALDALLEGDGA